MSLGRRLRRARQGVLFTTLLVVALWGYLNYRADNFTFAWSRPFRVLVVAAVDPLSDPGEDVLRGFLSRFLSQSSTREGSLAGVERWFRAEQARWASGDAHDQPHGVKFSASGPLKALESPPLPPPDGASFHERWRGTRRFLGYFEAMGRREGLTFGGYDAVIFLYFFDEERAARYKGQHSVASRRNRMGIVFSPIGTRHFSRAAALVAHELCHTLGASDKYEGDRCVFPDGFAEPEKRPLYPQEKAEIMALGIPESGDHEERVESIFQCMVGRKTAREMGWTK